jgi:hypothetical protein
MTSWKTTVSGIAAIVTTLAGVATAIANDLPVDWGPVAAAIMFGIGLIMARDNGTTSEQAGAK